MTVFEPIRDWSPNPADAPSLTALKPPRVLGIDVGGANLKFCFRNQTATCRFPMWRELGSLASRIRSVANGLSQVPEAIAITMTGELADCFDTRRQGVEHILSQLEHAFSEDHIFVYGVDGTWLSTEVARGRPWDVAASNWHALATWIAQAATSFAKTVDLVVDVGSTTVDIVPVRDGQVTTAVRTDRQRLQQHQLVYTGYERTPVASITHQLVVEGKSCPLMAERFADSLDAYLALGYASEDPEDHETADGRARTRACARARLARMVGEDSESLDASEIESMAQQIVDCQAHTIVDAVRRNLALDRAYGTSIMFCGHGHHLIDVIQQRLRADDVTCDQLGTHLGLSASRNASAIAVASLLEQHVASTG